MVWVGVSIMGLYTILAVWGALSSFTTPKSSCMFAVSQNENKIYRYIQDSATGYLRELTPAVNIPGEPGGATYAASYNEQRDFLVVNELSKTLSLFHFKQHNCELEYFSTVDTGVSPTRATTDNKNRYMYVTNMGDNTISQFRINPQDGHLIPLAPNNIFSVGDLGYFTPSALRINEAGTFGILVLRDMNIAVSLSIDQSTGQLSMVTNSQINTGIQPRTPKFDNSGHVLIPSFRDNSLYVYDYESQTGKLAFKQKLNSGGAYPLSGVFLDSTHFYLSNLETNDISLFEFTQFGEYEFISSMKFGVDFFRGGRPVADKYHHAYIAAGSNKIWQFSIESDSSLKLLPIASVTTGNSTYNLVLMDHN